LDFWDYVEREVGFFSLFVTEKFLGCQFEIDCAWGKDHLEEVEPAILALEFQQF
jgi:hypothetical protein